MIVELTDKNFESAVAGNDQPMIIDFWTQWCGPCKMIDQVITSLAEENEGKVLIGKVDADINPELCSKYGVRNVPTVLFMKNGEIVDKQVGATSRPALESKMKALL